MRIHRDSRSIGIYVGRFWVSIQVHMIGFGANYTPQYRMVSVLIGFLFIAWPARR